MPQITNIKRFINDNGYVEGKKIQGFIKDKHLHVREFNDTFISALDFNKLSADDIDVLMFELAIIKQKISGDHDE